MFTHAANNTPALQRKVSGGNAGKTLADNRTVSSAQRKIAGTPVQTKNVSADNDSSLEKGADVPGTKAVQLKATGAGTVVQLEKNKQIGYTLGGGVGLGLTGAAIGSAIPGIGTLTGGLIGLAAGAIGGYLYSKPKSYSNREAKDYNEELEKLREYQYAYRKAKDDYTKGTVVKYSKGNERKFIGMLTSGNVLYTYDVNSQLSIGSGISVMKHSIVSGNKNIKAAGWAKPQATKAQGNQQMYSYYTQKLEHFNKVKKQYKPQALSILSKLGIELDKVDSIENESQREIVSSYKTAVEQAEYATEQLVKLEHQERQAPGVTKRSPIQLDNESGHYHPGTDTKGEAFEGWKAAGFTSLIWKPWGKTK